MQNDNGATFPAEVEADLESVLSARVRKVLETAEEHGWHENPTVSVVVRLAKPEDKLARPFFMSWHLSRTPEGKRSWRFAGARASNGQPLGYNDCLVYLQDPAVIYPVNPDENASTETEDSK